MRPSRPSRPSSSYLPFSISFFNLLTLILFLQIVSATSITPIHEAGRCAIRGNCGSEGFFSPQLPCPDNDVASSPKDSVRTALVEVCGNEWNDVDKICCNMDQIKALKSNLARANTMIASCPACQKNFANLFCTFTCSPDQSMFVNVTNVKEISRKNATTELDYFVSDAYGQAFYDSCKEVKFGGSNGRAMDLIGGGAKNYTKFLQFLGDKKILGSPFQINFPRPSSRSLEGMKPMDQTNRSCNDLDKTYRCACVDCPASCAELPDVAVDHACHVGILPCLSFAVIIVYCSFLLLLVLAVAGHVAWQKHAKSKTERLRLLQDNAASDGEEDEDMMYPANNPTIQRHYYLNTVCTRLFSKLGFMCAEYPALTIFTSTILVLFFSLGWSNFSIETAPVRLWVAPSSAAAAEKTYFDQNFGPFYRAEQAFLVNDTTGSTGPVLSYDILKWWFDVENRINRLQTKNGITLQDVCFKPVDDKCVVQSVTGYFQGEISMLNPSSWAEQVQSCATTPVNCLPEFQQPLNPQMIFGNYTGDILESQALMTTLVIKNHPEASEDVVRAMEFEDALKATLLDVQKEALERGLRLSFTTESSLEEELNKSTNTDAKIVAISYVVMFLYASIALGSTSIGLRSILRNPVNAFVQSKFMLGIIGIVIVLMSISASVGLFSALGVKVTLIIAEVIPFLVLAVGVDNIFLIVHEFERVNLYFPELEISERMAKALGRMGPSILLSATTETVTFALGTAVGMPAVRNFAAYAAGAVFINALLQVTMFISVLALNQRRLEDGRADCVPCAQIITRDQESVANGIPYGMEDESSLERFFRKVYAPALMDNKIKVVIITLFLGFLATGLALIPDLELGLDQRIAIPSDSYLIDYFNDLDDFFGVGPPVYFVTKELNVTQREHQVELCGRFLPCHDFSLSSVLEGERKRPNISYIADATASWVDDFFLWLNPGFESCCVEDGQSCFENRNPPWSIRLDGMPEGPEYIQYLQKWLISPTSADCPLAGEAAYGNAVVVDEERLTINASHFRTSHTPLKSQSDFISAYRSARRIANDISRENNIDVFPYSKFYIFFDQYLSIVKLTGTLLGTAAGIIFILSTVLLGSLRTGLVVTATVSMTIVSILGCMSIANVSLNAVSLVNLVICVGIALEFCAHIARAFTYPSTSVMERAPKHGFGSLSFPFGFGRASHLRIARGGNDLNGGQSGFTSRLAAATAATAAKSSRNLRAWAALVNVGASVFSGITVTKVLGVTVLAFTRSKIFEIYYFRVWAALVVCAAAHALVFLPVALSLFGGRGYVDPDSEGGLEQDLRSRREYPSLMDDEYESDED